MTGFRDMTATLVLCGKGKPATAVACLGMSSKSEVKPRYFVNPVAQDGHPQ